MTKGQVIFRTGGDRHVGFGHIRRCLSLAGALRQIGVESIFVLGGGPKVIEAVSSMGYEGLLVDPENDLAQTIETTIRHCARSIIVDSYAIQPNYFRQLRTNNVAVVAIDDVAHCELPVDLVVNGSVGADLLPYRCEAYTKYLLGPQYILLRPEFAQNPQRTIRDRIEHVLITVGGSDPYNLTPRFMRWVNDVLGKVALDVVVGPLFHNVAAIESLANDGLGSVTLHYDPVHIRSLMISADLVISGGGQTTYELAATGAPTIATRTADNQIVNLTGFARSGALVWAGDALDVDIERAIKSALADLARDCPRRQMMSNLGRALVDGLGAERIAGAIGEYIHVLEATS